MTPLETEQFKACLDRVRGLEMSQAELIRRVSDIERRDREHDKVHKVILG